MNFQNDRYTLRLAEPGDDDGIREIFTAGHFDGGIAVQYLRPEPLRSFAADGDETRMLIIRDNENGRLCAVGGAVIRREVLHGTPAQTAYLTGLKVHPDYQKQIFFIAKAYQFLGEQLSGCAACYTTILDDNAPVIKMLEKKRRSMPEYRYLGHYTTYIFHQSKAILPLGTDDRTGFDAVQRDYFSALDLSPAVTDYPGFGAGHFYAYREHGELLACCFCGDQTALKCYKMAGYGGIYKLLSKLPTRLLGYPAFPCAGQIIRHGVISQLYVKGSDPALCRKFVRSVAAASGAELLLWGAFETHPLCPALEQMRVIRYGSRLYEVLWNGAAPQISRNIGMEAALL